MQSADTEQLQNAVREPLRNRNGRPLRIGMLHREDTTVRRTWSGIMFYMAAALETHVGEVIHLGPDNSRATDFVQDQRYRLNRLWRRLTGNRLLAEHNRALSWQLGRFFRKRLRGLPCDVIFAPAASIEIAGLKTSLPIVYFSDITWDLAVDYYPQFQSLSSMGRVEGERIEARAIRRAGAVVYPSQWAAGNARRHYGASPESTFVVPFGANLAEVPARKKALDRSLVSPIRLLLVGVDWARKGGSIAFDCLTSLLKMGIDARLTVCGCVPPPGYTHPDLEVIPFLDKDLPEHRARLSQLYLDSHFFVFPTRAEAAGIVVCEASAHGLPALVADTGGTGSVIRDGVNGFLMPFEADGAAYAAKIAETVRNPDLYRSLVASSRDEYEARLNWDAWGRDMRAVFGSILARQSRPQVLELRRGTPDASPSSQPKAA